MVNAIFIPICLFEMFFFGLMIGYEASKRADPNEPKPNDWEDKLRKRFIDGYKYGTRSMAKRMTERLKDEEITRAVLEYSKHKDE